MRSNFPLMNCAPRCRVSNREFGNGIEASFRINPPNPMIPLSTKKTWLNLVTLTRASGEQEYGGRTHEYSELNRILSF